MIPASGALGSLYSNRRGSHRLRAAGSPSLFKRKVEREGKRGNGDADGKQGCINKGRKMGMREWEWRNRDRGMGMGKWENGDGGMVMGE